MNLKSVVSGAIVLGVCFFLATGAASAQDFVPGVEREITRDSALTPCVGDLGSPACAFETVLYCMVLQDQKMCEDAGVHPETDCHPEWITKIRYAIEQVYGVDETDSWGPRLVPLSDKHRHARVVHRVEVCVRDLPCASPTIVDFEEADRRDGVWKVRSPASAAIYERQCYPADT